MSTVLSVDVGKSGCRAVLFVDGVRTAGSECPGPSGLADPAGMDSAVAAIGTAVGDITAGSVDALGVGLAGLAQSPGTARELARRLANRHGTHRVVLASDMTTSHLGALGGHPGVVVAGGTGAVALAVSARGETARVDGWGYLLGDAGSGYDIGRRGLESALRAHDGRGGSETLRVRAAKRFGDLDRLSGLVHGAVNPARTVAAFARDVLRAAQEGDLWSRRLWTEAGIELAHTAAAAASGMPEGADVAVSATGGLFDAGELLTRSFEAELGRILPQARLLPRRGDALDGGHLMATHDDLPHEPLLIRHEGESR